MSHFAKYVTGSTRLGVRASIAQGTESAFETSAYIKGDSVIVMAIDTTATARDIRIRLPFEVQSCEHIVSTSNESLCKKSTVEIAEPTKDITIPMPARSLNTFIFMKYNEETGIEDLRSSSESGVQNAEMYDLSGRRTTNARGITIKKGKDGKVKKILKH